MIEKTKVEVGFWVKGMKVVCPQCSKNVAEPYVCKCGCAMKVVVRLKR